MNCGPFQEPLAEMLHLGLGTPCWVFVSTKHFGSTPCIKRSSIPLSGGIFPNQRNIAFFHVSWR